MRHRLTAALIPLLFCAAAAQAQVRLVEAGIICPREARGELIEAPGTEAGHIRRIEEGMSFDLLDRIVPTMDDLSFGFRTALKPGATTRDVTVVVTHPPMGPRGVEREEWDDVIEAGTESLNLFTFEEDYEKVPGRWTFAIEIDGEPVVTVPFEVTEDTGRGRVEQACFQFLS
ncbi:DUF3859 domain-containing protein [Jannaschia sp. S6380]|uniref:DUF3859 domain-containing protein n=1 Tax=Jannaschia sp. S6380 TaxID=2926408 RepID=UPI001FF5ECA7|nr:DUF3859 domain-containing protein [Jannaschia sp. S6380]MCK0169392.1 DUF3859 domain-containing protein [Jannaschia sp. S6380]